MSIAFCYYASAKRKVVVDECPQCGGHWLDPGELRTIRTEYATEGDRKKAASEYFPEVFGRLKATRKPCATRGSVRPSEPQR